MKRPRLIAEYRKAVVRNANNREFSKRMRRVGIITDQHTFDDAFQATLKDLMQERLKRSRRWTFEEAQNYGEKSLGYTPTYIEDEGSILGVAMWETRDGRLIPYETMMHEVCNKIPEHARPR